MAPPYVASMMSRVNTSPTGPQATTALESIVTSSKYSVTVARSWCTARMAFPRSRSAFRSPTMARSVTASTPAKGSSMR